MNTDKIEILNQAAGLIIARMRMETLVAPPTATEIAGDVEVIFNKLVSLVGEKEQ